MPCDKAKQANGADKTGDSLSYIDISMTSIGQLTVIGQLRAPWVRRTINRKDKTQQEKVKRKKFHFLKSLQLLIHKYGSFRPAKLLLFGPSMNDSQSADQESWPKGSRPANATGSEACGPTLHLSSSTESLTDWVNKGHSLLGITLKG